jgi:hypothetical protein
MVDVFPGITVLLYCRYCVITVATVAVTPLVHHTLSPTPSGIRKQHGGPVGEGANDEEVVRVMERLEFGVDAAVIY